MNYKVDWFYWLEMIILIFVAPKMGFNMFIHFYLCLLNLAKKFLLKINIKIGLKNAQNNLNINKINYLSI